MKEIIIDTILDSLKVLPFLFIAFLIIEYSEHKLNHESTKAIKKAGKFGPIIGSLLGAIPQCGFSASAYRWGWEAAPRAPRSEGNARVFCPGRRRAHPSRWRE